MHNILSDRHCMLFQQDTIVCPRAQHYSGKKQMQALPMQPCSATAPAKPNHVTVTLKKTWAWAGGMQHVSSPFIQCAAFRFSEVSLYVQIFVLFHFKRTNNHGLCIVHKWTNANFIQMKKHQVWRSKDTLILQTLVLNSDLSFILHFFVWLFTSFILPFDCKDTIG